MTTATYKRFTGLLITAKDTDPGVERAGDYVAEQAKKVLTPLGQARDMAEQARADGCEVTEVIIEVNGEREEMTFDEFAERYG